MVLMLSGTVPDFQKFPILVKASEAEKNFLAKQDTPAPAAAAVAGGDSTDPGMTMTANGANRLYIGNLHVNITDDDLKTVLAPFGQVEQVHIHRDEVGTSKGYAFVKFVNPNDAHVAMNKLAGLELAGKPIKVGFVNEGGGAAANNSAASGNWRLDDDEGTGMQMNAQGRAALMARLGQTAGMTDAATAPAAAAGAPTMLPGLMPGMLPGAGMMPGMAVMNPALAAAAAAAAAAKQQQAAAAPPANGGLPPAPIGVPNFCIVIKNMFDLASETEAGWDADIKEDVEDECSKYGAVMHSHVETQQPGGFVYMLFSLTDAAVKAATALNGRWFAGRGITVEYLTPEAYEGMFPDSAPHVATSKATAANRGA